MGFDMDYTLAIYRQAEIDRLSIEKTAAKMVERGRPEALLSIPYRTDFPIRGLHVDKKTGNVLKMDRYRYVKRAYHGHRELTRDERRHLYHGRVVKAGTKRFHWVDTLYALPEVAVYCGAVEHLEAVGASFDYGELFDEVRACIDLAHADGSITDVIASAPERFIERDLELGPTLHKLRSSGKRLFLLTNSRPAYTERLMTYLLGDSVGGYGSWRKFFDVIVTAAKKPRFFMEGGHSLMPGEPGLAVPTDRLEEGRIYEGGCLTELERLLGVTNGDEVLYVGDHIYGDVLRAKKESAWRTMMIVQEMRAELEVHDRVEQELARIDELNELREALHDELRFRHAQIKGIDRVLDGHNGTAQLSAARTTHKRAVEKLRARLALVEQEHDALEDAIDKQFHPYWGSLFKTGPEVSSFGDQVEQYACLYAERVSCLGLYSPTHYFRGPRDRMPHEL